MMGMYAHTHAQSHTRMHAHPPECARTHPRLCIVFKGVPSLLTYLETLIADPEVGVLRVKNHLDPVYRPSATAGFRSAHVAAYYA